MVSLQVSKHDIYVLGKMFWECMFISVNKIAVEGDQLPMEKVALPAFFDPSMLGGLYVVLLRRGQPDRYATTTPVPVA